MAPWPLQSPPTSIFGHSRLDLVQHLEVGLAHGPLVRQHLLAHLVELGVVRPANITQGTLKMLTTKGASNFADVTGRHKRKLPKDDESQKIYRSHFISP